MRSKLEKNVYGFKTSKIFHLSSESKPAASTAQPKTIGKDGEFDKLFLILSRSCDSFKRNVTTSSY